MNSSPIFHFLDHFNAQAAQDRSACKIWERRTQTAKWEPPRQIMRRLDAYWNRAELLELNATNVTLENLQCVCVLFLFGDT